MIKYDVGKISKDIMYNGFFSEYLPKNFNLNMDNFDIFNIPISSKNDFIEPYKYTMSRFSENDKRRTISLPEITSYIDVMKYMNDSGFIKEFLDISIESEKSFSKLVQDNGELYKHEQSYNMSTSKSVNKLDRSIESKSTFVPNIIKKMNIAKGAKGVLYLDISNFFGSIYTHILPAIALGYDETMKQFKLSDQEITDDEARVQYNRYKNLDKKIRILNGNRTNGILIGPLVSKLIGETLLVKIDSEISKKNINFTRFVDDYEVYVYDYRDIEQITNIISDILNKYYLDLNHEKTKYISFPYYKFENLDKIINSYGELELDSYELMELFNTFFELEANGTKGAIRYLIKAIYDTGFPEDEELFVTYLLNILVNDNRSLTKVCELLVQEKQSIYVDENFKIAITKLLVASIDSKKELEVIWLLYLMKSMEITDLNKDIAKKIIESKNELAIIVLIYEFDESIYREFKGEYIESATSWILLYQLFLRGDIEKEELVNRLGINKNYNFYNQLKRKNFSFYKKI